MGIWEYDNINNEISNEIWKSFTFEGKNYQNYFVSNLGRIKNKNRILKLRVDNNGYYSVGNKAVHIIVATQFINNINNQALVNHKDGNKLNNNIDNLEWVSPQGNSIHAINTGLRKNVKKVIHIDNNGDTLNIYNSCVEASKILNINASSVNKCCKGEIKTCRINKIKFKFLIATDNNNNNNNNNNSNNNSNNDNCNSNNILLIKKKNIKKICVYNKQDKLIETCNSIVETSKKYKINSKTIINHCDGVVKHSKLLYYFRYSLL